MAEEAIGSPEEIARIYLGSGEGLVPVSGRSMRPFFEDASRVRVRRQGRARFGDVAVYRNGDFLVAHRIVGRRRGPRYRTKGDGLPHLDVGFVAAATVVGVVVEIERQGRRYRTDGPAGRAYGRLLGAASAVEGFLYRAAYRLDLLLTRLRGRREDRQTVTLLRRAVRTAGRGAVGALDGLLFRRLHASLSQSDRA